MIEPSVYLTNSCPQSLSSGAARIYLSSRYAVVHTPDLSEPISPLRNSRTSAQEYPPLSLRAGVLASLELYTTDQVVLGVHGELAARHLWIKIGRGRLEHSSDPF